MTGTDHGVDPRRHLAFVGMAGSGKSALSRRIAAALGRPVLDVDALVVATDGRAIPDIFATDGEAAFREMERRELADALDSAEPVVIATGGGIVESRENRELLSAGARVVWLDAPHDVLVVRLRNSSNKRPLLEGDLDANLRALTERREHHYRDLADLRVVVGNADLADTAARVLDEVLAAWPDLRPELRPDEHAASAP